jgi:hypothetical protein
MGRHSASDDDDAAGAVATAAVPASATSIGRHATAEDAPAAAIALEPPVVPLPRLEPPKAAPLPPLDPPKAGPLPLLEPPVTLPAVPPEAPPQTPPAAAGHAPTKRAPSGTQADLNLLRQHPAVRAQCAAAVLVPFVIYTVVMVVISRTDVYLVWIWLPIVSAGILLGAFLDRAHRRLDRRPDG